MLMGMTDAGVEPDGFERSVPPSEAVCWSVALAPSVCGSDIIEPFVIICLLHEAVEAAMIIPGICSML